MHNPTLDRGRLHSTLPKCMLKQVENIRNGIITCSNWQRYMLHCHHFTKMCPKSALLAFEREDLKNSLL